MLPDQTVPLPTAAGAPEDELLVALTPERLMRPPDIAKIGVPPIVRNGKSIATPEENVKFWALKSSWRTMSETVILIGIVLGEGIRPAETVVKKSASEAVPSKLARNVWSDVNSTVKIPPGLPSGFLKTVGRMVKLVSKR